MKLWKLFVGVFLVTSMMFFTVGCGDSENWIFGSNHEYATRDDGLDGVEELYEF